MTTISRDVTKTWGGDQRASTQLISVPKDFWVGRAELVRIEPGTGERAWARVLDGRSADFWQGPAVFGDHQTMSAETDLLVVQFFAEGQEQGVARGIFRTVEIAFPTKPHRFKIPDLRFIPKKPPIPRPGPVELVADAEPTPAYVVLEGAQELDEREVVELLQRLDEQQSDG